MRSAVATGHARLDSRLARADQARSTIAARVLDACRGDRVGCDGAAVHVGLGHRRRSSMETWSRRRATAGRSSSDGSRPRIVITRVSPLRWATTFFAECGRQRVGARTCAAALAEIVTDSGQASRCRRCRMHWVRQRCWTAARNRRPDHFARALSCCSSGVDAPFDRAESQRRAAAALAVLGRREEAVEHLIAAHRTARRLGAKPTVERIDDQPQRVGRARRAPSRPESTGQGRQRQPDAAGDRGRAAGGHRTHQSGDCARAVPQPPYGGITRRQHPAET